MRFQLMQQEDIECCKTWPTDMRLLCHCCFADMDGTLTVPVIDFKLMR